MATNGTEVKYEDKKHINLVVRNQHGEDVQFKVKLSTRFEKIFNAYHDRKGLTGFRYIFDGQRVHAQQTPAELGMEDGDVIEAMIEQQGGR